MREGIPILALGMRPVNDKNTRIDTAVLIVTRERPGKLERTLQGLAHQTVGALRLAVFVLDSGSDATTLEAYRRVMASLVGTFGVLRLWHAKKNIGPAAGLRFLSEHIPPGVEFVVKLDDDVLVDPVYLESILGLLDTFPEVGAVTGVVRFLDAPAKVWEAGFHFLKVIVQSIPDRKLRSGDSSRSGKEFSDIVSCAMVIRRSALAGCGGFPSEYFLYKDDTDLCYRLRQSGYKLVVNYAVAAYHDVPTSRRATRFVLYNDVVSRWVFARKFLHWYEWPLFVVYTMLIYPILRLAVWLVKGKLNNVRELVGAVCDACVDVLLGRPNKYSPSPEASIEIREVWL